MALFSRHVAAAAEPLLRGQLSSAPIRRRTRQQRPLLPFRLSPRSRWSARLRDARRTGALQTERRGEATLEDTEPGAVWPGQPMALLSRRSGPVKARAGGRQGQAVQGPVCGASARHGQSLGILWPRGFGGYSRSARDSFGEATGQPKPITAAGASASE